MKFLIDMNLSPPWVSLPRRLADSEIIDFAAANGWIVFTHDLDFGMLLAALRTKGDTPVVQCEV
jgi:predicted nuclease of predicted toxin-antitoxin system